jgi:glutathione S-transferase
MITLFAFAPGFGLPAASPFVTKTMIHLQIADLPYRTEIVRDLSKAPKGKLPFIEEEGRLIADSDVIRRHLERRHHVDLDAGLEPAERAVGHALTKMAEEHLYRCTLYEHWQIEANWPVIKAMFFGGLPAAERDRAAEAVRAAILRDLRGQGMGRHGYEEMVALAAGDLAAIAAVLGARPFLFGDRPSAADAAIAPQLQCIIRDPFESPLTAAVLQEPRLVAYAARLLARFFDG